MKRKKILILFPLEHIAFSPTVLGIYDSLSDKADVTIYCPRPREFKVSEVTTRDIRYFSYNTKRTRKVLALPAYTLAKIKKTFGDNNALFTLGVYDFVRYLEYKKAIAEIKEGYDEVIAVDMLMLFAAQAYWKSVSFISLELNDGELRLLNSIKKDFINSVVVQSIERYNYLFPGKAHRTFLIQNAPVFTQLQAADKRNNALLYNGTATPWFGMYHCMNFIKAYPHFTLTFKGVVLGSENEKLEKDYNHLIRSGSIIFNREYTDSASMLEFMSEFEIGFCFYDLSFPKMNTFNYQTAPSGKMFAYFAAGVPVIGNNLPGLKVIEDFGAGILIDDFGPETIHKAITTIKSNYDFYRDNCLKAAEHYSFDRHVAPYAEFIINKNAD